jgi:hypothetical protein
MVLVVSEIFTLRLDISLMGFDALPGQKNIFGLSMVRAGYRVVLFIQVHQVNQQ